MKQAILIYFTHISGEEKPDQTIREENAEIWQ